MSLEDRKTDRVQIDHEVGGEKRATLLIYNRDGVELVRLSETQPVVIGRALPSDVQLNERRLSRQHARFELTDGQVWLEDLESTNGTWVNGDRIARCHVSPGDEIVAGGVLISINVVQPREGSQQGLDSHHRFVATLEHEIVRARTFGRPLCVAMLRAAEADQAPLITRWLPRVREALRPVDYMGLYGRDVVEIALPELDQDQARRAMESIVGGRRQGEPQLLAGIATYPDSATSAQELIEVVWRATQKANPAEPVSAARSQIRTPQAPQVVPTVDGPVVLSEATRRLYQQVTKLANAAVPVLVFGETGTGKELVARALHERGPRKNKAMRAINCGAIPQQLLESLLFGHERGAFTGASQRSVGYFEAADGGTVLLDEIGELPLQAQAALLRVLETKRVTRVGGNKEIEVDVRVVAATHRDLEQMCEAGSFRWDLLYRLNAVVLQVPPLRARLEEIEPLAQLFIREANETNNTSIQMMNDDALDALQRYYWPGNVRELRNVIGRAVLICNGQTIMLEDLPEPIRAMGQPRPRTSTQVLPRVEDGETMRHRAPRDRPRDPGEDTAVEVKAPPPHSGPTAPTGDPDFRTRIRNYEISLLLAALEDAGWNQSAAAVRLAIPLRTLAYKVRSYDLQGSGRVAQGVEQARAELQDDQQASFKGRVARFEAALIARAIEQARGNKSEAARILRIPPRTLANKISAYGLS